MTDRGGGASLLPYTPAGVMGRDDDDDQVQFTVLGCPKGLLKGKCKRKAGQLTGSNRRRRLMCQTSLWSKLVHDDRGWR